MKKKLLLSNCDNLNLEVVIMEPKKEDRDQFKIVTASNSI